MNKYKILLSKEAFRDFSQVEDSKISGVIQLFSELRTGKWCNLNETTLKSLHSWRSESDDRIVFSWYFTSSIQEHY